MGAQILQFMAKLEQESDSDAQCEPTAEDTVEDEEDEDSEDVENIIFQKCCKLSELKDSGSGPEELLAEVELKIVYDDDVYGARIVAYKEEYDSENDDTLCNHLIAMQTKLQLISDTKCSWSALDFSSDPPAYKYFVAEFQDPSSIIDFKEAFYEGKELAENSEIIEQPTDGNEASLGSYYGHD